MLKRAYEALRAGVLPKWPNYTPQWQRRLHKLDQINRKRTDLRNTLLSREQASAPFTIEAAQIGPLYRYKDIYCTHSGQELTYAVSYQSHVVRPARTWIYQGIGDNKRRTVTIFLPKAAYTQKLKYKVEKPQKIHTYADIRIRRLISSARVEKDLEVGVLNYEPKPVEEYPVGGADNTTYGTEQTFEEGKKVYPHPVPDGVQFDISEPNFLSGVVVAEGDTFRVEPVNISFEYTLRNNTGETITASHWGFLLSVLYADKKHSSSADIDMSIEDREISNGASTSYSVRVTVPEWAYGYLVLTHALKLYRDNMLCYSGGPMWSIRLGRVFLP